MTHEHTGRPVTDRVASSDLVSVLRDRAPRAALALAAGQLTWPLARWAQNAARQYATYTVKVPGTDSIYDDLHEWVLSLLPERNQRALVAWTSRTTETAVQLPGWNSTRKQQTGSLRLRYDGTREHAITIDGHKIRVQVTDDEGRAADGRWKPPEIIFTARSLAARSRLLAEIRGVLHRSVTAARKPVFRMLDQWGDWETLDHLPPRGPETVILPDGQMDRLLGDVARFLAAEAEYARRCIPWHRGHLYEGEPGTGKTSVARAIATHFGMDVWYLPLADVKKDGDLLRLATRIGPRSMLLLEDIDVFHAATSRDDDASITLSGLLNVLDGIATPPGLLTVMTTNPPDAVDQAMIRPGRVDLSEHFGTASREQAARLISRYYDTGVDYFEIEGGHTVTPAAVIEICKRHDTAADALAALARARAVAG